MEGFVMKIFASTLALCLLIVLGLEAQSPTWSAMASPDTVFVSDLSVTSTGTLFCLGYYNGSKHLFSSTNLGDTWSRVTNDSLIDHQPSNSLLVDNDDIVYVGISEGVSRSTDNGVTWSYTAASASLTLACVTSARCELYAYGPIGMLYRTQDSARTWTVSGTSQSHLVADSAGVLHAVNDGDGAVYRSTNNGATWVHTNFGLGGTLVHGLTPHGSRMYASTSGGGVFRSTNGGISWLPTNAGVAVSDVRDIVLVPGGVLAAGTWGGGVLLSTDNGDSWTAANSSLSDLFVRYLLALPSGRLIAVTHAASLFRTSQSIAGFQNPTSSPATFALHQNFPNPLNPTTQIRFEVPLGGFVSLSVYNILGEKVATLLEGELPGGSYTRTFDAKDLAGGVYFARLHIALHVDGRGEITKTRKMVLLK